MALHTDVAAKGVTVKTRFVTALVLGVAVTSFVAAAAAAEVRTQLVSKFQGFDAIHGNSSTWGEALSGNGRVVVFSVSDDALPGADGTRDIYVRDRSTGRTRLVSKNSAGDPADSGSSDSVDISQNGRFVVFSTFAGNLPGGSSNSDVYIHDRSTAKTRLVSKTSSGQFANGQSDNASVSADGRFVAFYSNSTNLPGNDAYGDVYVHDRRTGKTRLVSKTSTGVPADGDSNYPSLSGDGSRVAFYSDADNLPGPDAYNNVYVHDLATGKTRLVSKTSSGGHLNASSSSTTGAMSAGGRFVGFESNASNLPGGALTTDVYLHDLRTGKTRLVSKTSAGIPADATSEDPSVSGSGRFVAFASDAANLGGAPGFLDVFVFDRRTGRTRLVSRSSSGAVGDGDSFYPAISADARFVAFSSRSDNFSGQDDNDYSNVFVRGPLG
jgi:hypothetical protein